MIWSIITSDQEIMKNCPKNSSVYGFKLTPCYPDVAAGIVMARMVPTVWALQQRAAPEPATPCRPIPSGNSISESQAQIQLLFSCK